MCIEREKVDFKSREVNCLKECALALNNIFINWCRLKGLSESTLLMLFNFQLHLYISITFVEISFPLP